jgi:hypothetical protein
MPKPRQSDVLQEIARLRRARQQAPQREQQAALAAALDALDVMGTLETARRARGRLCHGPKAVYGMDPAPWSGAVLWQRAPGYYGYRVLTLIGVWALQQDDAVCLTIGTRPLPYRLDFYDGEAYHKLIRRDFAMYYLDPGTPPAPDSRAVSFPVEAGARLAQRDAIRQALARIG